MKKGCGMEMESPSWRWAVSYTTAITRENLPVKLGIMLLQIMAGRLVLLGNDEEVVDARYLRRDEVIQRGRCKIFLPRCDSGGDARSM
jgi:hypothetical protein